jgi:hypothetical protein
MRVSSSGVLAVAGAGAVSPCPFATAWLNTPSATAAHNARRMPRTPPPLPLCRFMMPPRIDDQSMPYLPDKATGNYIQAPAPKRDTTQKAKSDQTHQSPAISA